MNEIHLLRYLPGGRRNQRWLFYPEVASPSTNQSLISSDSKCTEELIHTGFKVSSGVKTEEVKGSNSIMHRGKTDMNRTCAPRRILLVSGSPSQM